MSIAEQGTISPDPPSDDKQMYEGEKNTDLARKVNSCPICGGVEFKTDWDAGERCCTDCGCVIESGLVDRGPEWRAFTDDDYKKRTRTGPSDSQLSIYKGTTFDIPSSGLTQEQRNTLGRMKYEAKKAIAVDSKDRNLYFATNEIQRLASDLKLPRGLTEEAAYIYRKFLEKDLVKGRSIDASVAASLYAAVRSKNIPRTLDEISKHSSRERDEIARTYRLLRRELRLKMPVPDAEAYIPKISSKLEPEVSIKAQSLSGDIIRVLREYGLTHGKGPKSLAVSALYLACIELDEKKTQKELAKAGGVTEVTIRNRIREWETEKVPIDELFEKYEKSDLYQ